ncbi:MAG: YitT family protein [Lachnospiraceae bacterium]|nr:YitT family protein [Lachnospiraceae bacterium]
MNGENRKKFIKQIKHIKPMTLGIKIALILIGILLYSISLKWFIYQANILPTGLTGLSYLAQRLIADNFNVTIPITIFNLLLNAIPALFCFFIVGKAYTINSFIIMFLFSFIADYVPYVELTKDPMICAIFGGLIGGYGASLWFRCGVSGGGTDFVAMSLSTKLHIQTFGWVLGFNIVLIIIQGLLYGWELSFYSIIYQYVMTQAINLSYRHYEARTIIVVTEKPDNISNALLEGTGHSSTVLHGTGSYSKKDKTILYTVVTQPEVRKVTGIIRKQDSTAFVNIVKSTDIQGNFTYLPVYTDDIDTNYGD